MARVSAVVDTVKSTESKPAREVLDEVCQDAVERTVTAGALRVTVKIVEKDSFPLPVSTIIGLGWARKKG